MQPGLGIVGCSGDEPEPPTRQAEGLVEAYQAPANRCLYLDFPPKSSQLSLSHKASCPVSRYAGEVDSGVLRHD